MLHLLMDQQRLTDKAKSSEYFNDLKETNRISNGYSLFSKVPNRNCDQAKIPQYLCSCGVSLNINLDSDIVETGAKFIVHYINNVLLKNHQDKCVRLNLLKVIDAQVQNKKYSLILKVAAPSNAVFDGTFELVSRGDGKIKENEMKYSDGENGRGKLRLVGNIIRINTYGSTSKCIQVYSLRNFCYCKKQTLKD
jgi:hypothetical protein